MIKPEPPPRIGIFGGTFDPPHNGHLALAIAAQQQLTLAKILWVPTPDPPHKLNEPLTPIHHRWEMVARALDDSQRAILSRIEMDRPGPHYAVDTVRLIKESEPNNIVLIYLMGSDSLVNLPTWHLPKEFIHLIDYLAVLRRETTVIDLEMLEMTLPGITKKTKFVEIPLIKISSRDIRQRVAEGRPFEHMVPAAVATYIREQHLYKQAQYHQKR